MSESLKYIFDPKAASVIDLMVDKNGQGVSQYGGQTLEQIRLTCPQAVVLDEGEVIRIQREAHIKPMRVIDVEAFMDALEVMPPSRWTRHGGSESFHLCERITHDIVHWYIRIGRTFYHCQDTQYLTHQQLVEAVAKQLANGQCGDCERTSVAVA